MNIHLQQPAWGEKCLLASYFMPELQKKDPLRRDGLPSMPNEASPAGSAQIDCFPQRNAAFTQEVVQVKDSTQTRPKATLHQILDELKFMYEK